MSLLLSRLSARSSSLMRRFPAAIVAVLAMAYYLYTLAPSVNWADGARMQLDVMLGGSSYAYMDEVASVTTDGLPFDRLGVAAWDHPLYVMLGQLFLLWPGREPSFHINLMSAVAAALAIGLTYQLAVWLVNDHWAAALGALSLAVSHTFWFHAVTSEAYSLNILLMALLAKLAFSWAQEQRWRNLYAFGAVAGLGVANHRLFVLIALLAGIFVVTTASDRPGFVKNGFGWRGASVLLLFLLGLAPWWVQFIRMAQIIGVPLTWELAGTFSLIENRLAVETLAALLVNLGSYLGWLVYQFTPLGVMLGVLGFGWLWQARPQIARFLLATLLAYTLFSANFSVADRFNFHLPSFWLFSLGIACGASQLRLWLERNHSQVAGFIRKAVLACSILLPIGLYALAPVVLRWAGTTERDFGIYPIGTGVRDVAQYFLNPNKRGDDSAARFGRTTLQELAPQALVLTPKTSEQEAYVILRYFQRVEGMRPDVRIEMMLFTPIDQMPQAVLAQAKAQARCRTVYITSLNPTSFPVAELSSAFILTAEAHLYRLIPRDAVPVRATCADLDAGWKGISLQELIVRALRWP